MTKNDSAKVKKKSTAFLYIAKRNHTLCTLYINRRVHFVFYSKCFIYKYFLKDCMYPFPPIKHVGLRLSCVQHEYKIVFVDVLLPFTEVADGGAVSGGSADGGR